MAHTDIKSASSTGKNGHVDTAKKRSLPIPVDAVRRGVVSGEEVFHAVLALERRRAERSRKPFILMLLDAHQENGSASTILQQALTVVASSTRETDSIGWYRKNAILGVIFTELGGDENSVTTETLRAKIGAILRKDLGPERAAKIAISLHVFPENWDPNHSGWVADSKLYPDLQAQIPQKKISLGVKRAIDIAGSAAILLLMSPFLAVIALIIKLTSKGPVLFAQERLGEFGMRFKCMKFRTLIELESLLFIRHETFVSIRFPLDRY